jgi:dihydroflavonol-4-reductase
VPEARNKRFILSSQSLWFKETAQILKDKFPAYKIKAGEIGYCPVKLASYFDSSIKLILPMWNKQIRADNKQSREILGIQYIDASESIVAMANSMIEFGLIRRK